MQTFELNVQELLKFYFPLCVPLKGVGTFNNGRVIWAGVEDGALRTKLVSFVGDFRRLFLSKHRELFQPGDAKDKFDWSPHLTLFKKRFEAKGKKKQQQTGRNPDFHDAQDGEKDAMNVEQVSQSSKLEHVEMQIEATNSGHDAVSIITESVQVQETHTSRHIASSSSGSRGGRGRGGGGRGRGRNENPAIDSTSSSMATEPSKPSFASQLAQFSQLEFGQQEVEAIEFLAMEGSDDGFYRCYARWVMEPSGYIHLYKDENFFSSLPPTPVVVDEGKDLISENQHLRKEVARLTEEISTLRRELDSRASESEKQMAKAEYRILHLLRHITELEAKEKAEKGAQ
jgi:2'-5' RNA ligase